VTIEEKWDAHALGQLYYKKKKHTTTPLTSGEALHTGPSGGGAVPEQKTDEETETDRATDTETEQKETEAQGAAPRAPAMQARALHQRCSNSCNSAEAEEQKAAAAAARAPPQLVLQCQDAFVARLLPYVHDR
jgi:hypothetical protein